MTIEHEVNKIEPKEPKRKLRNRNLKAPFQKGGPSPNPKGRPPGNLLDRALAEMVRGEPAERIAKKMIQLAELGSVKAAKFIAERTEGRARDYITINGAIAHLDLTPELIDARIAELLSKGSGTPTPALPAMQNDPETGIEVIG